MAGVALHAFFACAWAERPGYEFTFTAAPARLVQLRWSPKAPRTVRAMRQGSVALAPLALPA